MVSAMKNIMRCLVPEFCVAILFLSNAQAQVHYVISPRQSYVKYFMKHPMHDWDATSQSVTGSIDLATDSSSSQASMTIPVTSFDSHNGNRDSHTAETVESYIFPNVSFKSTKVTPIAPANDKDGQKSEWRIEGEITFHGVNKSISVPAHVTFEEERLTAEGEFELKPSEFDIALPKLLMVAVKDWLKISFSIVAEAAPKGAE
jgi:polyisoprenoid-binding protein YceI